MRRFLVVLVLLVPIAARAQATVTVNLNANGTLLASSLGLSAQDLSDKIKAQLDSAYDTADVNGFLRQFADATSFSMRGLGVDYMSLPHSVILGIGGEVAAATDSTIGSSQRPTAGLAANVSGMIGINLADWGHPRWTVFANGFYRNGKTERLHGGITTAGAHLQYRLVAPTDGGGVEGALIRWAGIDVTSGVEYTRWTLGANDNLTTNFTVNGASSNADLAVDSAGKFDLTSTAATVPIEVTTGVRIALLFSVYVGVGFDFTEGKSTLDANLNGNVHRAGDNTSLGTVTVTGSGNNTASPGTGRALAGVQLNLWKLKIYAQGNASLQPAASLGVGVRLVL